MKKHLLLGTALVAAISAFPQNTSQKQRPHASGVVNMSQVINQKFIARNLKVENASSFTSNYKPDQQPEQAGPQPLAQGPKEANLRTANTNTFQIPATTWNNFTGSMNIYGVLVSASKPLQYNNELNAVTFVHRKSNSYNPIPVPTTSTSASGAIVTMISTNMGSSWDSTLVWNDQNNWARYPQGGIINAPLNTTLSNAHVVITAPITQANMALGWTGNALAWKGLGAGTYDNVALATGMSFVSNASPFTSTGAAVWSPTVTNCKVDFVRTDFSSNDDGTVWAMGLIFDLDANGTTAAAQAYRGARLLHGQFISGAMVWSHDSIIPSVRTSALSGNPMLISQPGMAWSEDGTHGYVWHIGAQQPLNALNNNDTLFSNRGYQPIVYKTNDGGMSWQSMNSINFNLPAMRTTVLSHIYPTNNDTMQIPFFNATEGISGVVDANNRLHLVSSIYASAASDPDSSEYTHVFPNFDGQNYRNLYLDPYFPRVFDFTGDGTTGLWTATVIDTMTSEDPGVLSTDDGYSSNPWDNTGGTANNEKVDVDARIQASRTSDGKYITYSWAETDTLDMNIGNYIYYKWNKYPNVRTRLMDVTTGAVSSNQVNVTSLTNGPDGTGSITSKVYKHAYNFYACTRAIVNSALSLDSVVTVTLPMTVSNNIPPLRQLDPVTHWYSSTNLQFRFASKKDTIIGIKTNSMNSTTASHIYPNPAKNNATLAIDLKDNSAVYVNVVTMVGQVVKSYQAEGQIGSNNINVDLSGLQRGIYMVNVKVNNASSTKKLVVE